MPYDPTLPAANSQISSAELRGQLTALKGLIDALPKTTDVLDLIYAHSASPVTVTTLSPTVSNPPTQAQVQAIVNKLNELITALELPPA